jgi:tetratricopeptide (TPR) repeat protein
VRKDALSGEPKKVDWFLALMAIVFTIIGGLLGLLQFGFRNEHKRAVDGAKAAAELAKQSFESTQRAATEVEKIRTEITKLADEAKTKVANLDQNLKTVHELGASVFEAKTGDFNADSEKAKNAASVVSASIEAPMPERLYASGLDAAGKSDWSRAAVFFAAADAIQPNDSATLFGWGVALSIQADAALGDARASLLREAISKYEAALKIKPDQHEALNNLGIALGKQADAAEGDVQSRLRSEAISKYEAALKIKPDKHEALNNWGTALDQQADAAEGETRARLRGEAISKYEAALNIKPDEYDAWCNWGLALGKQAYVAEGEVQTRLLNDAIHKFDAALRSQAALKSGVVNCDRAFIAALCGNAARFVEIVDSLPDGKLPDQTHIDADKDLNGIRETPEFRAWYARTFP